jgi:hypothetical protein
MRRLLFLLLGEEKGKMIRKGRVRVRVMVWVRDLFLGLRQTMFFAKALITLSQGLNRDRRQWCKFLLGGWVAVVRDKLSKANYDYG